MIQAILIVEDDPDGQELVAHVVRHLNIPNDVVDNAEIAAEMLFNRENAYQAVIIDLQLPGKDGMELLSDIRNHPATENLTCVAVTAYHTSKTREAALHAGFNAYFPKPLDASHFARELENLL